MDAITIEQEIAAKQEFQKAWLIALDERDAARTSATMRRAEADELRNTLAQLRELYTDREHDLAHEFKRANDAEAERDALREQVVRLTTCDCGLPLSAGQCGICDNDE